MVIFLLPVFAQAGVFSAIKNVFKETAEAKQLSLQQNAQVIPLLKAAVHSNPNPSKGGGDIIVDGDALVPDASPLGSDNCNPDENEGIYLYTVRPDENLSNIAEAFCISTKTILWANDIKNPNIIQPGDELVILPITGVSHVVKSGETVASIAKKYGHDVEDLDAFVDDIVAYNQLADASDITPGEAIIIPGGEIAPPPAPKRSAVASTPSYTSSGAAASGYYGYPVRGGATRSQGIHGYNGIDLASYAGAEILAAAGGDVIVARASGWNGGYGSYVVVKHGNGTQTLYAHLSSVAVYAGQTVSKGQVIGGMGSTGRSTGTHLHFEVRGARNPF